MMVNSSVVADKAAALVFYVQSAVPLVDEYPPFVEKVCLLPFVWNMLL